MILLSRNIVYLKLLGLTIIMLCIAGCAAKKSISIDKEEVVAMEEIDRERAIEIAKQKDREKVAVKVKEKAMLKKGEIPPKFYVSDPLGLPSGLEITPRLHVWDMLVQEGDETLKYGMYTYVLFGRRVKSLSEQDTDLSLRYEYLLNAIIDSTDTVGEARTNRAESNIFYIPSKKIFWDGTLRLADYNSSLARIYISRLSVIINKSFPNVLGNYNSVKRFVKVLHSD